MKTGESEKFEEYIEYEIDCVRLLNSIPKYYIKQM